MTILYNRDHVVFVELADKDEPRRDPGYDVATEKIGHDADVQRHAASRRRPCVSPAGTRSLERFRAGAETFRYLEAENATYIINVHHLVELAEETPAP